MNYAQIVSLAVMYADREDIEVNSNVDNFILLTEARINRLLKTREQTGRIAAPTREDEEYYCLPNDYRGMRDIQLNSSLPNTEHKVTQLHYLSPEQMNVQREKETQSRMYYTVIANKLQVWPRPPGGCSIEMIYYRELPNLREEEGFDSNWLSESHPDIYNAGITGEIETFAKNYEIADSWFKKLSTMVGELDYADDLERWAGQALVMRAG
ncbi:MAG: hypothetical protein DRQ89_12310 [Epsilonproteobacteria bacterium]|nr:MAG: hypothetical protein DRQ89_12310 [Campylobacterota bacterium]